jgi:hypothetical protein
MHSFKALQSLRVQSFSEGSGHVYRVPVDSSFHLNYSTAELTYDENTDPFKYPMVIELRATDDRCQFTYCSFVQNSSGVMTIKPFKQKIILDGQAYELADIYGFDSQMPTEGDGHTSENAVINIEDSDPDDSKCVVCITDQADTAVIPCRHMCMCYGCAKILRLQTNKCPICRTLIENLIVVGSDEPHPQEVDDEIEDEEEADQQEGIATEMPGRKKSKKEKIEKEPLVQDTPSSSSNIPE